jgi:hypothetical protein
MEKVISLISYGILIIPIYKLNNIKKISLV